MFVENEYCRAPVAHMFNAMPGYRWIPSRNVGFKSESAKGGYVMSGEPDGRVHAPHGIVFYVECKAFFGGVYFTQFRENQLTWYRNNCVDSGSGTLHFIAAGVYSERERPDRMNRDLWRLFLVPTDVWLCVDNLASREYGTGAIPLNMDLGHRKWRAEMNVEKMFAAYELERLRVSVEKVERGRTVKRNELRYRIPERHAVYGMMREAHCAALRVS
jgi:hypothetical protein